MLYMIIWKSYYYIFFIYSVKLFDYQYYAHFYHIVFDKIKKPLLILSVILLKILTTPVKGLIHSEHWHTLKYQMRTCKYSIFHY